MKTSLAIVCVAVVLATAAPASAGYGDAPGWASTAVKYVAQDHDWMLPSVSDGSFHAADMMKRREWARALVKAYAPTEAADPTIVFYDMTPDDPDFTFAAVAVKHAWITASNGSFAPDAGVQKRIMDRSLAQVLGLQREMSALNSIKTADGKALAHRYDFSYLVLAEQLRFHYNYPTGSEGPELLPATNVRRVDGAFALYRAQTLRGSWLLKEVARYRSIVLPAMDDARRAAVEFAFSYAGWPYVYAGEWFQPTPDGYCCGPQVQGGFDCSGWTWWVLRAAGNGFDNTAFRPYAGWPLKERASYQMAGATTYKVPLDKLVPLDLAFYGSDTAHKDASSVNHVGMALGNGWMIHSSGGRAGVTIDWISDGWWRDHYHFGRRIVPVTPFAQPTH